MKRIIVGVSALALVLAVAPSAVAQDDPAYGVTSTTLTAGEECGTATVVFDNPTQWTFWGDYRIGDETGTPDGASSGTIAEGPLEGESFGDTYHLTELAPESSETVDIVLPEAATGTVPVSAWVKRGPEQRSFSTGGTVDVTACEPVDPSEPPVDPSEPPVDPSEPPVEPSTPTDPSTDPSVDPSTTNPPADDDQDGDEAEDDGDAPTPTPQKAHLAVTG